MRKHLNWLFTFLIGFSGYLFFVRPASTASQLLFRLGVLTVGIAGLLVLALLRFRDKNAAKPFGARGTMDHQA
jgi:hypothetical protein